MTRPKVVISESIPIIAPVKRKRAPAKQPQVDVVEPAQPPAPTVIEVVVAPLLHL